MPPIVIRRIHGKVPINSAPLDPYSAGWRSPGIATSGIRRPGSLPTPYHFNEYIIPILSNLEKDNSIPAGFFLGGVQYRGLF
jgi:hypothetical protein